LAKGERLIELLKQDQYVPMRFEEQALITFAGTAPEAFLMSIPVQDIRRYESELMEFVKARHNDLLEEMRSVAKLTDDIRAKLVSLLTEFGEIFETTGE
jgi:F-type H+-transporting ATPase subunit alpha